MANTTNYNWETPDDTDLVKDGAAAIRTLGSSIDTTTKNLNPETTTGDIAYRSATANTNTRLAIGTTGQVLTVAAGVPSWATPTDQTPLTTKGDVFTFSTVDARLGVGANGTVLTADSAEATGLKWAAPASPTYVGAMGYFFSSQNLTSGVAVVLTFADEAWDTNGFHSTVTNTSRMTIPANYGGKYLVQIVASVTTGTDTSIRLLKNGSNISSRGLNSSQLQQHVNTGGNTLQHSASFVIDVAATDYLEAALVANAASKVCTDASFSISYLGA